jgi:hypothetical protein
MHRERAVIAVVNLGGEWVNAAKSDAPTYWPGDLGLVFG